MLSFIVLFNCYYHTLLHTFAVRSTNHECLLDLELSPCPLILTFEPHQIITRREGLALNRFSLPRTTFGEQGSSFACA